jgi:hypothetical protein
MMEPQLCPVCKAKGREVKLITLKSMLKPQALATLDAKATHYFCDANHCEVVYFQMEQSTYYDLNDVKVNVHQKDNGREVPICYCFGWTKEKIDHWAEYGSGSSPIVQIKEHIQEKRCGCEINNPQGSCCLGNMSAYLKN